MKSFLLIVILLFLSCAEGDKGAEIITASTDVENKKVQSSPLETAAGNEVSDDLEVHDFESFKKYLDKSDDKTYVINFWATWCKPCIKELPYFEELNKNYGDSGIEVILVSLDFPTKYESHLKPYIKQHNLNSTVIALDDADSNSWIPKVNADWSGAIPATLIYNKNSEQFHEGSFTYEELLTAVKPFIEKK